VFMNVSTCTRVVLSLLVVLGFALPAAAQNAEVSILKMAAPDPVERGANLDYTITVSNEGPDDAASMALTDPLPAETTFVSLTAPAGWSCTAPAPGSNGTVNCTFPSFSPGGATFDIIVNVIPTTPGGTVISNTATVSSTTPDPNPGDESATATATVEAADLSVSKMDTPDPVVAGTNLSYDITVTNAGPHDATSAVLNDPLPSGTTFVSLDVPRGWTCTTPAAGATGTISCSSTLFAPRSDLFTLVVAVAPSVAQGSIITNTATASAFTTDPDTSNQSGIATTTVAGSADLSLTKVDNPDPVTPGANLTYTIGVSNTGPSYGEGLSLSDSLPPNTTFVSLSTPAGWSCTTPAVGGTGTVTCTAATFAIGSASLTLTVATNPSLAAGATITNTATISASTPDPNATNQSGTATTTTGQPSADVTVTKVDTPDPVTPGNNLTYTITVTDAGPSSAAGVSLSDPIPANTTFVSLASPGGWSCATPAVGGTGTVTCTIPTLAPGPVVFTLVVATNATLANGLTLTNTASVASTTVDPNLTNQTATATTATGTASADLSVTKVDTPDPVFSGANISYNITVTNAGPSTSTTGTLTDTLPPNTTFVSLTSAAGWTCTAPPAGSAGTVSCTTPSVAVGSASFTLVVQVGAAVQGGTTITNTATVSGATTDPNPANQSATATTSVLGKAKLSATKSATGIFAAGTTVTYSIVIRNGGTGAQADNPGHELTDVLPASLQLVSATASSGLAVATAGTNTVTWDGSVSTTVPVTITIQATIPPSTANGTTVSNQATLSYDSDANGTNDATAQSDDPSKPGATDPTTFLVAPSGAIPTLDPLSLGLLAVMLAAAGLWTARRG
jgi:uncharacterized repeat protein (TIGR01451 family)